MTPASPAGRRLHRSSDPCHLAQPWHTVEPSRHQVAGAAGLSRQVWPGYQGRPLREHRAEHIECGVWPEARPIGMPRGPGFDALHVLHQCRQHLAAQCIAVRADLRTRQRQPGRRAVPQLGQPLGGGVDREVAQEGQMPLALLKGPQERFPMCLHGGRERHIVLEHQHARQPLRQRPSRDRRVAEKDAPPPHALKPVRRVRPNGLENLHLSGR